LFTEQQREDLDMEQKVLLINGVAELLQVSASTISRWSEEARNGNSRFPLPISVKGGKRRWLLSDIESYLASQSTATSPQSTTSSARQKRRSAKAFQERQNATDIALGRYRGKGEQ